MQFFTSREFFRTADMARSTWKAALLLSCVALLATGLGTLYSTGSADLSGQDQQPLAFSHEFHSGTLQLDCLYCHRSAVQSPTAGIPSLQLCMSCHRNVKQETQGTKELLTYWESQTPISWIRLQRLPDFVYFTHEMHLVSGLECVSCHGRVDEMPATPRAATMEMGWCLSCHRQQDAPRDCWTCHK